MTNHPIDHELTAYEDNRLPAVRRAQIESHLAECRGCLEEAERLQTLKVRLGRLPRHEAPFRLLTSLKYKFTRPKRGSFFPWPARLWKPVGAFALTAMIAGAWLTYRGRAEEPYIMLEPLLAAHSRYQADNLVPTADLVSSNFSGQLAVYHANED